MGTICIISHPSINTKQVIVIIVALKTAEHPAASPTESNQGTETTVILNPFGFFGSIHDFKKSTNGL